MKINQTYRDLKSIGFIANEIDIYVKLLAYGEIGISDFARLIKIPRTTVVENIDRLEGKELITRRHLNKRTFIKALPPSKLHGIAQRELITAQEKVDALKQISSRTAALISLIQTEAYSQKLKASKHGKQVTHKFPEPTSTDIQELEEFLSETDFTRRMAYVINESGCLYISSKLVTTGVSR